MHKRLAPFVLVMVLASSSVAQTQPSDDERTTTGYIGKIHQFHGEDYIVFEIGGSGFLVGSECASHFPQATEHVREVALMAKREHWKVTVGWKPITAKKTQLGCVNFITVH